MGHSAKGNNSCIKYFLEKTHKILRLISLNRKSLEVQEGYTHTHTHDHPHQTTQPGQEIPPTNYRPQRQKPSPCPASSHEWRGSEAQSLKAALQPLLSYTPPKKTTCPRLPMLMYPQAPTHMPRRVNGTNEAIV
jgi:hypothetical protein